jgi:hypothetical protein
MKCLLSSSEVQAVSGCTKGRCRVTQKRFTPGHKKRHRSKLEATEDRAGVNWEGNKISLALPV